LISLGTVDDGGVWVADLIYVSDDDLNIYWMSSPQYRRSLAIDKNCRVAGTITISQTPGSKDLGVQLCGVATKLGKTENPAIATRYLYKTKGSIALSTTNSCVRSGDFNRWRKGEKRLMVFHNLIGQCASTVQSPQPCHPQRQGGVSALPNVEILRSPALALQPQVRVSLRMT
jgi:hypothetical protein